MQRVLKHPLIDLPRLTRTWLVSKLILSPSSTMFHHTQVLQCDPSHISFSNPDFPTVTDQNTLDALRAASKLLYEFQPVAFPTETVYGLGALALDSTAASRIFSTKGRPPDNPLIVHVSSHAMLRRLLPPNYQISRMYEILMDNFWPGALTLLFPTNASLVPPIITANKSTVAVRMPSHPVARALIAVVDAPIAAPSANSSGKPSPTRADHVLRDLKGKIDLILDGGQCEVGLESTVVDGLNEDGNLRVLRPGGVTVEDIENVLREKYADEEVVPKILVHKRDYKDEAIEEAPTTPGMKYRHYSPAVPVILLRTSPPPESLQRQSFSSLLQTLHNRRPSSAEIIKVGILAPSDSVLIHNTNAAQKSGIAWQIFSLGPTAIPSVAAQRLFDGLLTLEKAGVDLILIEEVKEQREGLAVMNRVKKAAGEVIWVDLTRG